MSDVIGAGKVAVVTGAASGIGRALAEAFAVLPGVIEDAAIALGEALRQMKGWPE